MRIIICILAFLPMAGFADRKQNAIALLKRFERGDDPLIAQAAGEIYLRGEFVPQDWKKARTCYRMAVSNGVFEAQYPLQLLDYVMEDEGLFLANRGEAIARAVARDPDSAQDMLGVDPWPTIPALVSLLHEIKGRMSPRDGKWHGVYSAQDWAAAVRTNRQVETCADFRDKQWAPFVCREFFSEAERQMPWYPSARKLIESAVDCMWRSGAFTIRDEIFSSARQLADAGCENVAILWLASYGQGAEKARVWIDRIEQVASRSSAPELGRFLAAVGRRNWEPKSLDIREASVKTAVAWLRARKIPDTDSRCLYATLSRLAHPVRKELAVALRNVPDADPRLIRALEDPRQKPAAFPECAAAVADGDFDDTANATFASATEQVLDDWRLYNKYAFYACSLEWGAGPGALTAFGEACYATERFDTMIPMSYLDAQFRLGFASEGGLADYFADRERFAKCMRVCNAMIENQKNVYVIVRRAAIYCKAMLTYWHGDLHALKDFFTEDYWRSSMPPTYMVYLSEDYGAIVCALAAMAGQDAFITVPLHEKFRSGDYKGFLAASKDVEKHCKSPVARDYLQTYRKIARIKDEDYDGSWVEANLKTSSGEFFTRFPEWHCDRTGTGWFVEGNQPKNIPLKWNMPLSDEYDVEFLINPLVGCEGRACATVQYWVKGYEDYVLPEVTVEFWGGKASMRIQTSRDHERAWRSPTAAIRYEGGSLRVRVRYEDGKVMAWLGETMRPTLVAEEFGAMFKKLNGKGGSSVICARGICVKSWKGRKIVRK